MKDELVEVPGKVAETTALLIAAGFLYTACVIYIVASVLMALLALIGALTLPFVVIWMVVSGCSGGEIFAMSVLWIICALWHSAYYLANKDNVNGCYLIPEI